MWTLPGQCLDQTLPRRRSFSETHNHINALGITVSLMLLGYVNHITLNVTVVHLVNETQKFFSTNFILIRQYWSNLSYGSNVMFKTAKDECQFNSIPWTSPWRMSPKVNHHVNVITSMLGWSRSFGYATFTAFIGWNTGSYHCVERHSIVTVRTLR